MATSRELKVGLFALGGLIVAGLVIFLIGEERKLFETKAEYHTSFQDVQGLRRGSPVRMGGVDIGTVSEVAYGERAEDRRIHVVLAVVRSEARRIRQDSVASIEGKGLLGDKMIVVTVGTPSLPEVAEGGSIKTKEGDDITQLMAKLGTITGQVEKVVTNLERTTNQLADDNLQQSLRNGVQSLSGILRSVDQGEGYVGRLVKSPEEADRLSRVVQNLERASAELDRTAANVNSILNRVQQGPGLAHEVLYGDESSKAVAQFGGAADELRQTLKGIREGNGIARSVIYGDEGSQQMMRNLNDMSGDLKQIVADMKSGKGTLGALLVDPSVYEDLKMVLGNVERNKALRALVRYSIRRDESAPTVEVRDPSGASTGVAGSERPAGADRIRAQVGTDGPPAP